MGVRDDVQINQSCCFIDVKETVDDIHIIKEREVKGKYYLLVKLMLLLF